MSARRRLSERQVLEVLIVNHGAIIPCGICRLALKAEDLRYVERDHHRAKHTFLDEDLDQWEALDNQRYVHGLRDPNHDCHRRKTDGTKATTAGSDKHMAAKGRRLRLETKKSQQKAAMKGKHFRTGAKIQSRGFPSAEERRAVKEKLARVK